MLNIEYKLLLSRTNGITINFRNIVEKYFYKQASDTKTFSRVFDL